MPPHGHMAAHHRQARYKGGITAPPDQPLRPQAQPPHRDPREPGHAPFTDLPPEPQPTPRHYHPDRRHTRHRCGDHRHPRQRGQQLHDRRADLTRRAQPTPRTALAPGAQPNCASHEARIFRLGHPPRHLPRPRRRPSASRPRRPARQPGRQPHDHKCPPAVGHQHRAASKRTPLTIPAHLPQPGLHPLPRTPRILGRSRTNLPPHHRHWLHPPLPRRRRPHHPNSRNRHPRRHRPLIRQNRPSRRRHIDGLKRHPPLTHAPLSRNPPPQRLLPHHQPASQDRRRKHRHQQHHRPPTRPFTPRSVHAGDANHPQ